MGWFSRRREEREAKQAASIAGALVQALPETAKSQAQFGAMVGGWIKDLGDLSVRRSAALMGARGGRTTQNRRRLRQATRANGTCPLCLDSNFKDVSVQMIVEHRNHGMSNGVRSGAVSEADNGLSSGTEPGSGR